MREKVIATVNAPHPAAWSSQKVRAGRAASRVRGEVVSGGRNGLRGPACQEGEEPTAQRTAPRIGAQREWGRRPVTPPGSRRGCRLHLFYSVETTWPGT